MYSNIYSFKQTFNTVYIAIDLRLVEHLVIIILHFLDNRMRFESARRVKMFEFRKKRKERKIERFF